MISDYLNLNSLPYPGSTLLMEFGSQETRDMIAAAYRGQLYNSRIFTYQKLPSLVMSIIIHGWAVYDNWTRNREINFKISNSFKYQPMLLLANALVSVENLTVNGIRGFVFKDPKALLSINFPVIIETLKQTSKYFKIQKRGIEENEIRIRELERKIYKRKPPNRSAIGRLL